MDGSIIVYKTNPWEQMRRIASREWRTIFHVTFFHQEENWVAFGGDASVRIWDFVEDKEVCMYEAHTKQVRALAITKNDQFVCSGGHDRCARVYDLVKRVVVAKLDGHKNHITAMKLTPDDTGLVTAAADCTLRMWSMEDLAPITILRGHTNIVKGLDITLDGRFIVSVSLDRTIRIWNIKNPSQLAQFEDLQTEMHAVAVSRSRSFIYTGGKKGGNEIKAWHFMNRAQKVAIHSSPIVSNVEVHARRHKIEHDFVPYAFHFQSPGLAEALIRHTRETASAKRLDIKTKEIARIFFPVIPELYSFMHVCGAAPFPMLLKYLLEKGELYSVDHTGKTPLTHAIEQGSNECVSAIIEHFHEKPDSFIFSYADVTMLLERKSPWSAQVFEMAFFDYNRNINHKAKGLLCGDDELLTS